MKNRTKLIILTLTLCFTVIFSVAVVFFVTRYNNNSHFEYVDLGDTSINLYNMDNNFYHYDLEGYTTSIGVDLSEFNGDVDFNKLKKQNIEYAYLRIGWRGYIIPSLHDDKKFEEYYKKAKEAGIDVGVYFFSQAINEEEAIEEANFVIKALKNKKIDTHVVFDFETIHDNSARTNDLTRQERTNIAKAFLSTIQDAGYNPMLYTNYDWIVHHYTVTLLHEYPVWYAQYSKKPQYHGHHIIWQYSTNVMLDGITSSDGVDLNIMIKKEETN